MEYQLEELSLEVTNECPLACIHCSSGSGPGHWPGELTCLEHVSLVRQAREDLGATVLSFSGGNPLHCDHLVQLIDSAANLAYARILIYTVGYNREGPTIESWPGLDVATQYPTVTWIFSLHSPHALVNDKIMGTEGAHDNIITSIQYLVAQGQSVELHMVPMKPNYQDIPKMVALCERLGIEKLSLLRFVPQTRGLRNINVLGMDKTDFARLQVLIYNERQRESTVEIRAGCPIDFSHAMGLAPEKARPCHAGDDLILVRPTGEVFPCAAWKSMDSNDNVRDHSLAWIWENSAVFNYVRDFKQEGYMNVEGCASCPFVHSCRTGCFAQRIHAYGGALWALYSEWSDPLCPRGKQPRR